VELKLLTVRFNEAAFFGHGFDKVSELDETEVVMLTRWAVEKFACSDTDTRLFCSIVCRL
jgi:hypothetical protein